jgi:Homeodomain-like domain
MRSSYGYRRVLELVADGDNDCEIARKTGVPRRTISDWRNGRNIARRLAREVGCPHCGQPTHDLSRVEPSYAYLLGLYLGDGHIVRAGRTWRLRIFLDLKWLRIILLCGNAMERVFYTNRVAMFCPQRWSWCAVVSVYSSQLPCLFPQHGPGMKHLRRIELAEWQQEIVEAHTEPFLRGLIHSDGCRFINRVRVGGKTYEYPRYNFTNASAEIRKLFTDGCDRLGVEWRRMNARNISVARRESVVRLDEFIGPKH